MTTLTLEQINDIASGNRWPTDAERKTLCDLAIKGLRELRPDWWVEGEASMGIVPGGIFEHVTTTRISIASGTVVDMIPDPEDLREDLRKIVKALANYHGTMGWTYSVTQLGGLAEAAAKELVAQGWMKICNPRVALNTDNWNRVVHPEGL